MRDIGELVAIGIGIVLVLCLLLVLSPVLIVGGSLFAALAQFLLPFAILIIAVFLVVKFLETR